MEAGEEGEEAAEAEGVAAAAAEEDGGKQSPGADAAGAEAAAAARGSPEASAEPASQRQAAEEDEQMEDAEGAQLVLLVLHVGRAGACVCVRTVLKHCCRPSCLASCAGPRLTVLPPLSPGRRCSRAQQRLWRGCRCCAGASGRAQARAQGRRAAKPHSFPRSPLLPLTEPRHAGVRSPSPLQAACAHALPGRALHQRRHRRRRRRCQAHGAAPHGPWGSAPGPAVPRPARRSSGPGSAAGPGHDAWLCGQPAGDARVGSRRAC